MCCGSSPGIVNGTCGGRSPLGGGRVVPGESHFLVDDPTRGVPAWPRRVLAEVLRVVGAEVASPARPDEQRIARAHVDALRLHRLIEMRRRDLELRR